MTIKGWGLTPRPTPHAAGPNSTYIDLSTSKTYVVENNEWREVNEPDAGKQELPDYTVAMQGKVLAVANDGTLEWVTLAHPQCASKPESTAATIAALRTDFNALLSALKAAGLMAADSEVTE